jgi:hypothetical protein
MAAENENIPMAVDGDVGEEDYTADAAAEALEEAFEAGDFPTVAEMATTSTFLSDIYGTYALRIKYGTVPYRTVFNILMCVYRTVLYRTVRFDLAIWDLDKAQLYGSVF